jgi:hypothetical protein
MFIARVIGHVHAIIQDPTDPVTGEIQEVDGYGFRVAGNGQNYIMNLVIVVVWN